MFIVHITLLVIQWKIFTNTFPLVKQVADGILAITKMTRKKRFSLHKYRQWQWETIPNCHNSQEYDQRCDACQNNGKRDLIYMVEFISLLKDTKKNLFQSPPHIPPASPLHSLSFAWEKNGKYKCRKCTLEIVSHGGCVCTCNGKINLILMLLPYQSVYSEWIPDYGFSIVPQWHSLKVIQQ